MIDHLRSLENIVRLDRDAPELSELVATGQPVIIRDILVDTFIAPVDDRDHVLRTFGAGVAVQIDRPKMPLAEYFAAATVQPGSIAAHIPSDLEARLSAVAKRAPLSCVEPVSVVWIGRAGCKQR